MAFFNGLPGFNPYFLGLPGPRLFGSGLDSRDDVLDVEVDVDLDVELEVEGEVDDLVHGLVMASFTALYPAFIFLRILPIFHN